MTKPLEKHTASEVSDALVALDKLEESIREHSPDDEQRRTNLKNLASIRRSLQKDLELKRKLN